MLCRPLTNYWGAVPAVPPCFTSLGSRHHHFAMLFFNGRCCCLLNRGSSVAPQVEAARSGDSSRRDSKREHGAKDKEKSKDQSKNLCGYIDALTINCDPEKSKDKSRYKGAEEGGRKEATEKHRNRDACLDDFKFIVFKALANIAGSSGGRDRRKGHREETCTSGVNSVCSSNGKNGEKSPQSNRKNKGQSDDGTNSNRSANESSESSFWDEGSQSTAPTSQGSRGNQV